MIKKANRTLGTVREPEPTEQNENRTLCPHLLQVPTIPLKNDEKDIEMIEQQPQSQLHSSICARNGEVHWDTLFWRRNNLVFKALVSTTKSWRGRFVASSQHLRPKDIKRIILQQNWNEHRKHFSMWHIIKLKYR